MNQQLSDREEADREELDHFKREIDLVKFAEQYGFEVHSEESNQRVTTLRRGDDKMLVWHSGNRHDTFWNVRTGQQGSILDFTQQQEGCRLGAARLVLRRWLGVAPPRNVERQESRPTQSEGHSDEPDRKRIAAVWSAASWTPAPTYLTQHRGLDVALHDERFMDCYRTTKNGAILFLHHDRGGPSGYELRGLDANGERLKAFAKGGKRGLWHSRNVGIASTIVVAESAIDALSHCELYPEWQAGYVSIAGEISTKQKDLLSGLFEKADSRNARIVVATDNDDAGDKHFKTMVGLTKERLFRLVPIGKDWNDDLRFVNREN